NSTDPAYVIKFRPFMSLLTKQFQMLAANIALPVLLVFSIVVGGCSSPEAITGQAEPYVQETKNVISQAEMGAAGIPSPAREFRAGWVATVAIIDRPSEPGVPVIEQKKELLDILSRASAMNMNAVIFQVRPAADALYDSSYEPWSYFLT